MGQFVSSGRAEEKTVTRGKKREIETCSILLTYKNLLKFDGEIEFVLMCGQFLMERSNISNAFFLYFSQKIELVDQILQERGVLSDEPKLWILVKYNLIENLKRTGLGCLKK